MTPQETAEKIVGMLNAIGCAAACGANVYPMPAGSWWVTAGAGSLEEPVFYVGPDDITFLLVRSAVGTLRARKAAPLKWEEIGGRCVDIAALMRNIAARKATNDAAWAVVDELKKLGMVATMCDGRVVITLDFSAEYAREMGPKLLAVLGERKAGV